MSRTAGTFMAATAVIAAMMLLITADSAAQVRPASIVDPAAEQAYALVDQVRSYEVVDLGDGEAFAINDDGQVVGTAHLTRSAQHSFLWDRGTITDLGVLERGPYEYSRATDIDSSGRFIAGFSVVNGDPEQSGVHAVLWRDGAMIDLGTPGVDSYASAVNDRGQVVGSSHVVGDRDAVPPPFNAFLWPDGILTDLDNGGTGMDINDEGLIVGARRDAEGNDTPTVWRDGVATALPVPGGFLAVSVVAVNNDGWIVGQATGPANRGLLWRKGAVIDLGSLGGDATMVNGINDWGQVFGASKTSQGAMHTFIWQNGRMHDLTASGFPTGVNLSAMNNLGQFVGEREGRAVLIR